MSNLHPVKCLTIYYFTKKLTQMTILTGFELKLNKYSRKKHNTSKNGV